MVAIPVECLAGAVVGKSAAVSDDEEEGEEEVEEEGEDKEGDVGDMEDNVEEEEEAEEEEEEDGDGDSESNGNYDLCIWWPANKMCELSSDKSFVTI